MRFVKSLKEYKTRHSRSSSSVVPQSTELYMVRDDAYPESRNSSSASIRSTSSKKLAWLLGADSLDAGMLERPIYSRSHSTPVIRKMAYEDDSNWPLASESDDDLSDDDDEDCKVDPEPEPFKAEEISSPPITKMGEHKLVETQAIKHVSIVPDSPDVDALSVATFAPFTPTKSDSQCSTPRYQGNLDQLGAAGTEDAIDFNEVCERLLDTLSSSLIRPSLDQHQSGSSVASSKSSTKLFTEPASPQSFSSASSLNSLAREEKMEKTKSALVADQAALEAKLKLAAARDALKRVRSNVATPQSIADIARPAASRAYTTQVRTLGHARATSDHQAMRAVPTMQHSRSSSAINELTAKSNSTPRSSRSSRTSRDNDLPLLTQKSNVRIGIAAPKDLSVLKKTGAEKLALPKKSSTALKTNKGKAALYVPQNHITSINELMA